MSFTKVSVAGIGTTGTITLTNVSVAGVITATDATFTGNVSVAGTITYEDVTNVDSVGLITARSGIDITGGGGLNLTGGAGVVTATTYRVGTASTLDASGLSVSAGVVTTTTLRVAAGSAAAPSITPTDDTNTGIFFPSADTIAFGEGGSEAARIDSSGRLLVGTSSSPSSGDSQYARLRVQGNTLNDEGFIAVARNEAASAITTGEVIGQIFYTDSAGNAFGVIKCEADANAGTNDYPGRLVFSTTADGASSPTERMRITQAGNVLIGRTSAYSGERLVVANTLNQVNASYLQDYNGNVVNLALFHTYARVGQAATQIQFQDFNGIAVGSITNNTAAVAYNTTSDYRLKENIEPVTDGIARLQQLKPSRFNFISDPSRTVDGFIAHEVQGVVPEAIHGEKDAVDEDDKPIYQGIDQAKLVPLLTAALQEAIGEIETLKARVAALESA